MVENINKTQNKALNKTDVISRLTWIDAEKIKPLAGQEIIFIDAVGLFKGKFNAIRSGVVFVDGNNKDVIEWDDIYQWILYPDEFL